MDPDFDTNGQNDMLEITLKGRAVNIGNLLTGKTLEAIEDKHRAEKERDEEKSARIEMQSKLWKAQDDLADVKRHENNFVSENERLTRLCHEHNETIFRQEENIAALRGELAVYRQIDRGLTEEQTIQLAAERERVFQSAAASIQFPSPTPPKTFAELFSHFFFPLFERREYAQPLTETGTIRLIKMVRNYTGCGLKEAKDFVEGKAQLK